MLSSDDYGSSVERQAYGQVLWRACMQMAEGVGVGGGGGGGVPGGSWGGGGGGGPSPELAAQSATTVSACKRLIARRGRSLDNPQLSKQGRPAGFQLPRLGGAMDLPADRSTPTSPPPPSQPPGGGPVAASAAAHRGGPAAALSAADQRHRLAGGRGGAGRADPGDLRPRNAGPGRDGHGHRRRDRGLAGRPGRAGAGGAPAGPGPHRFLVGAVHDLLRAGAGLAGPAALAAPDRVVWSPRSSRASSRLAWP